MSDLITDRPGGAALAPLPSGFRVRPRGTAPIVRLQMAALAGDLEPLAAATACRRLSQPPLRQRLRIALKVAWTTLRYCWRNLPPEFKGARLPARATYAVAMALLALRVFASGDAAVVDTTPVPTTVAEARALQAEKDAACG